MISGDQDCVPIFVTLFGIVISLIALSLNAPLSMLVAPLGTVRLVIRVQPLKAFPPMTFNAEFSAIELFAGGQINSFVSDALNRHPPSDAYVPLPPATLIVVSAEQPENASVAILLVLDGIDTPDSPVQPRKAPLPIVVTPAGTAMEPRLLQFSNALLPMLLIEDEIATLVNAEQPLKVLLGMELTDACMLTDDSLVHPEKTPVPSVDTLPGTVIEVSPVQFENALFPMLVTEDGIVTATIFDFPEKAPAAIAVAVSGIVMLPPLPV